jgi:hypothetical protein
MVDRQMRFDAVDGRPSVPLVRTGIVDEYVQSIVSRRELGGEPAHVGAGREISGQHLYPVGAHIGRDSVAQTFSSLVVPAGGDDVSAGPGQFGRDDPAHPSGTSGDERDTATRVDWDVAGAHAAIRGACWQRTPRSSTALTVSSVISTVASVWTPSTGLETPSTVMPYPTAGNASTWL